MDWQSRWTVTPARAASAVTAAAGVWLVLLVAFVYGGNWSALFMHGRALSLPPELEPDSYRELAIGYDGQFYRIIARDPWLTKGYAAHIDAPRLRYRRILVPALAWVLVAGRGEWIDAAYVGLMLAALGAGVWACGRWLQLQGAAPWWGAGFALMLASLVSVMRMTVDLVFLSLFALLWWRLRSGPKYLLWVLLVAMSLTRETGFLVAGGLALHAFWGRERIRAGAIALTTAPALAWYWYVGERTPEASTQYLFENLTAGVLLAVVNNWQGWTPGPVLQWLSTVAYVVSLAMAGVWLWRRRPWGAEEFAVAPILGLVCLLGAPDHMREATGFGRPASPVLLAAFLWAVQSRRWGWVAPPLLVSAAQVGPYGSALLVMLRS